MVALALLPIFQARALYTLAAAVVAATASPQITAMAAQGVVAAQVV